METSEVLGRLQGVFDDVFIDEVKINEATTADDVDEWDSLTHVSLIVAIEKEFGVRFGTGEVEKTNNVGDLCRLIMTHLSR